MIKIVLASKSSGSFEDETLVRAAVEKGIDLTVTHVADDTRSEEAYFHDADVVYWRSGALTQLKGGVARRTQFLKEASMHRTIVNRSLIDNPAIVKKSVQQALFSRIERACRGVVGIPTYFAPQRELLEALIDEKKLTYPFIAKPDIGKQGKGVEYIQTADDIVRIEGVLENLIFQNFIPNSGDYRVLVVGGVAHDVMYRTPDVSGARPYLNNRSQGGAVHPVTDAALREVLSSAACTIAAACGTAIAGVDILPGKNGELYFLEINTVPQWEGMQSVSPRSVSEHVLEALTQLGHVQQGRVFQGVHAHMFHSLPYLPTRTQFHFLSRAYLWTKIPAYKERLDRLRAAWWKPFPRIAARLATLDTVPYRYSGGKKYRSAYIEKYSAIYAYNKFFFKCLFDETIFDGDAFREHAHMLKSTHHASLYASLAHDPEALFTLSTPAVNFITLSAYFCPDTCAPLSPTHLCEVGDHVSIDDPASDLDARIYFYTHLIIGRSRFYKEMIPPQESAYQTMITRLEQLISSQYEQVSLDHKCEFLVCARLCGYTSFLHERIHTELMGSVSPVGAYFINTQNIFRERLFKGSLETMEHTNVLALMAFVDPEKWQHELLL